MSIADIKEGDRVYVICGHGHRLNTGDIRTVGTIANGRIYLAGYGKDYWNKDRFLRIPAVGDHVPEGTIVRQMGTDALGEEYRTAFDYTVGTGYTPRVIISVPEDPKAAKIKELEQTLEQAQAQLRELRDS